MSDIEEEIEDDAIADGQDDDDPFGEAGRETGSSRGEYGSSSMLALVLFCLPCSQQPRKVDSNMRVSTAPSRLRCRMGQASQPMPRPGLLRPTQTKREGERSCWQTLQTRSL